MAVGDTRRLRVVIDGDSSGGKKAFEDIRDSTTKTEGHVKTFASRFGSTMAGIANVAKLTAGVAAGLFGLSVIKKGIDRLSTIEDATSALTIALGSATKAGKLMDQVLGVVRGTPFNLDQFATAAKNLVVFGVAADKVPKYLHAMGEAAAASGAGAASVEVLVNAFGDAATIGHITGDTLFTLASQGVPALKILANGYGVTTEKMQKMVSKGMVPATKGMDLLTRGIENGSHGIAGTTTALGGSMESLRKTFRGSLGGMEAAIARFGAALIGPFMGDMTKAMTNVGKALDTVGKKFASFDVRDAVIGMVTAFKTGTVASGGWRGELELVAVDVAKLIDVFLRIVALMADVVSWFHKHETVAKTLAVAIGALVVVTKAHAAALWLQNGGIQKAWKSTLLYQTGAKVAAAMTWLWNGAVAAGNWISAAVLLDGYLIKQKLIAVWSKIAAAGQWLWNVALSANPIGIVIIAIAAFVAAIILLWKHSDGFRKFVLNVLWPAVKAVWDAMKATAMAVAKAMVAAWNWIKDTAIAVWNAIVAFLAPIASAISRVISPIITVIQTIGNILWTVYSNAWKVVWILIQIAVKLAVAYFNSYVVPAFKAGFALLSLAVKGWQIIFQAVWTFIKFIAGAVAGWFTSTIVPAFAKAFTNLKNYLGGTRDFFVAAWRAITDKVRAAFNTIAGPIAALFNQFLTKIKGWLTNFKAGWNIIFDLMKTKVTTFKDGIVKAFNLLKDGVKAAWDKLVTITKAPINFIIGSVYSDRIVPFWNRIAEKFGIKTRLDTIPRLAKGGVTPGTGFGDKVPALLTPGEGVLTTKEMKILGGPDGFNNLRSQISLYGKYAKGGVVQHFADGGIAGFFSGLAKKGKDVFQGIAAGAVQPLANTIKRFIDAGLPQGGISGLMRAGGHTVIDKFMAWIRGKDKEVPTMGAGAFGAWPSSPGAQRGDSGVWRRILALVRASGIPFNFGNSYRPGDPKWHGSGRAIDFMGYNQDRLARFFLTRQNQVLELIHRSSSRDYAYTRGVNKGSFNSSLMQAHRNHLHIAMDGVSQVDPGYFTGYNGTGKKETLVNASLIPGGIHINNLNLYGIQNVKQLRDELVKLSSRNGGQAGLPSR